MYNHLLRKVFRFHYHSQKVIGSLGFVTEKRPPPPKGILFSFQMFAVNWSVNRPTSTAMHEGIAKQDASKTNPLEKFWESQSLREPPPPNEKFPEND